MNLKFPLWLCLLISTFVSAQETITIKGSKPYPATENYTFICERYALTGEANVQIAKTEKGGILKLSITPSNDKMKISGGVYVYFIDGDVIACVDRNVNETLDGKTTTFYTFTPLEMNKLKKKDIQSIRFNVTGDLSKFGNQNGNYTAVNKQSYFSTTYGTSIKTFDTAKQISVL